MPMPSNHSTLKNDVVEAVEEALCKHVDWFLLIAYLLLYDVLYSS
jgi:hypothetical protein